MPQGTQSSFALRCPGEYMYNALQPLEYFQVFVQIHSNLFLHTPGSSWRQETYFLTGVPLELDYRLRLSAPVQYSTFFFCPQLVHKEEQGQHSKLSYPFELYPRPVLRKDIFEPFS